MKLLACEICGDANNYCAECGTCFKCSAEDHEQQLQQVRKEVAREILAALQKCFFAVDFEVVRDNIKSKYGLDG